MYDCLTWCGDYSCYLLMYVDFLRSWWCCGEAPRGFQLAMLFLTWALLFLLLCMPSMANAEIGKAQADTDSLSSLGDGQEILEVTFKGNVLWSIFQGMGVFLY